jgi:hypothetical protein
VRVPPESSAPGTSVAPSTENASASRKLCLPAGRASRNTPIMEAPRTVKRMQMRSDWLGAETIEARRLTLEPLRVDHADEMVVVLGDPNVYAYTGGEPPSLGELRSRYTRQVEGQSDDGDEGWLGRARAKRRT